MQAKGCESCRGTGFQGRSLSTKCASVTPALQHLINSARASERVPQASACSDGYLPMRGYGFLKCRQGETTVQEVHQCHRCVVRSFARNQANAKPRAPAHHAVWSPLSP